MKNLLTYSCSLDTKSRILSTAIWSRSGKSAGLCHRWAKLIQGLVDEGKRIRSVTTNVIDHSIDCCINIDISDSDDLTFAFYILRNGIRIHRTRYSSNSVFSFDTKGAPGYYRIVGFAKTADGTIESGKSAPVFFRPLALTDQNLDEFDPDLRAYELKGEVWNFPALYYPGDTDTLFIMMPSAFDRKKSTLPVFNRWTWADQGIFPGHVLCIADPTLELQNELQLGWLLGHKSSNLVEDLANFVLKFAKKLSIPNHKIVVYGSSAGGFAALALAACIKDSTAVAINAQTDVLSFASRWQVNLIRGRVLMICLKMTSVLNLETELICQQDGRTMSQEE